EYSKALPSDFNWLTNTWLLPEAIGVGWNPFTVGKSGELVVPATNTLNPASTAIPALASVPMPPKYVEKTSGAAPLGLNLVTNTFPPAAGVGWSTSLVVGKSVDVVEPVT